MATPWPPARIRVTSAASSCKTQYFLCLFYFIFIRHQIVFKHPVFCCYCLFFNPVFVSLYSARRRVLMNPITSAASV